MIGELLVYNTPANVQTWVTFVHIQRQLHQDIIIILYYIVTVIHGTNFKNNFFFLAINVKINFTNTFEQKTDGLREIIQLCRIIYKYTLYTHIVAHVIFKYPHIRESVRRTYYILYRMTLVGTIIITIMIRHIFMYHVQVDVFKMNYYALL